MAELRISPVDFDDLIVERPPTAGAPADESGRRFYEGAVMLAYAMHLLQTEPVREVRIQPDGQHSRRVGFKGAVFGGWRTLALSSLARTPRGAESWFIRDQVLATSPSAQTER